MSYGVSKKTLEAAIKAMPYIFSDLRHLKDSSPWLAQPPQIRRTYSIPARPRTLFIPQVLSELAQPFTEEELGNFAERLMRLSC